jgi:uncharacterized phage-associated protein
MFDSHQREKLVNAINYFVRETMRCHTLKLFKLLNFLDFEHFRQTGVGVTGLSYRAWDKGPVPPALWHELQKGGAADLRKSVSVVAVPDDLTNALLRRDLKATAPFDASYFSKREMAIMGMLAEIFRDAEGSDMSAVSHARRLPWGKVYAGGKGRGHEIPYELVRSSDPVLPTLETLSDADYEYRKKAFS